MSTTGFNLDLQNTSDSRVTRENSHLLRMNYSLNEGDKLFKLKDYKAAIEYYKHAAETSLQINPNFYYTPEIYRRIALSYREIEKTQEPQKNLNHASHYYKMALKHSATYPTYLDENKKKQILVDKINDHFTLAKIYLIKNKVDKVFQYATKGLELNNTIPHPECHAIEESEEDLSGFNILADCMNSLSMQKSDIQYVEKFIELIKNLDHKYSTTSSQLADLDYNLQQLRALPVNEASIAARKPLKKHHHASFNNDKENSSMKNANLSIFEFIKTMSQKDSQETKQSPTLLGRSTLFGASAVNADKLDLSPKLNVVKQVDIAETSVNDTGSKKIIMNGMS